MFSPVASLTNDDDSVMDNVIENIRINSDFLRSVDRSDLFGAVFNMLVAGVTCLKHEGFREEGEWRVISRPLPIDRNNDQSYCRRTQILYKLPLDGKASPDLDLSTMFDRLIIGPSPYPLVMYKAFVAALAEAGIAEPRVVMSEIPIRT